MVGGWKGWNAVNCLNQSKITQSWCQKLNTGKTTLTSERDWWRTRCGDHYRAHIPISTFSNHSLYLWWDTGRIEMLWNPWINPNMLHLGAISVGYCSRNCHHPQLISQDVALVIHDELKPQPCKTIHYTYGGGMEGLKCCELPESVQNHSILVSKVEYAGKTTLTSSERDWRTRCGDYYRAHIPISTFSNR